MKTEFQKRFRVSDEFYTAQQIREAIVSCFPFEGGIYQGLSRITFRGRPIHCDKKLILEDEIPDVEELGELQIPLPRNYCYGIIEGISKKPRPIASSFFVPTDLGYICDEMILDNNSIKIYDERHLTNIA